MKASQLFCVHLFLLYYMLKHTVDAQATCHITAYPDQVRIPGIALMTLQIRDTPTFTKYTDAVTGFPRQSFQFMGTVTESINPQKCRWVPVRSNNSQEYFPDAVDTFANLHALSSEFGLPDLLCMRGDYWKTDTASDGNPIGAASMPRFVKQGYVLNPTDETAISLHSCFHLDFIESTQLLKWRGSAEFGETKVLECQAGLSNDIGYFHMIQLLQIECPSAEAAQLTNQQLLSGTTGTTTAAGGGSPGK